MYFRELWFGRTSNKKTGDVPSLAIGATLEERMASCKGCPLLEVTLPNGKKQTACYDLGGMGAVGMETAYRAHDGNPSRHSHVKAMSQRKQTATFVRLGSHGEPGVLTPERLGAIRADAENRGMAVVGYSHRWREPAFQSPQHKDTLLASCETLQDVDEAIALGFRAALVSGWQGDTPSTTPGGNKLAECPAITSRGKVTCNDCKLCDPRRNRKAIVFPAHGLGHVAQAARAAIWQAYERVAGVVWGLS